MKQFEKHDFYIEKNDQFQRYTMQIGDSICSKVVLTAINGVTLITGDYGNWVINGVAIPVAGDQINRGYALGKIRQSSTQVTHSFSGDHIRKQCKQLRRKWKDYVGKADKEELFEYIEKVEESSHDLYECVIAIRENPKCFDDPIYFFDLDTEINRQILYVFDCFDEMCKRLKKPVSRWNKLSERKPKNGQLCKFHKGSYGGIEVGVYNSESNSFDDNERKFEIWWKAVKLRQQK